MDRNLFFGVEHRLPVSDVKDGSVRASIVRELPLRAQQTITYSAVLGNAAPGQLRSAFLAYLETERPRPFEQFLHYNSWFDLGYGNRFDEAGVLDRIHTFGEELAVKRHVKLDSSLLDDGWDDTHTLWEFNPGFPNGLTKANAAASQYGARIGVWLSLWGCYDEEKKQRVAYGQDHGFENRMAGVGPEVLRTLRGHMCRYDEEVECQSVQVRRHRERRQGHSGSAFDSDFDAAIQNYQTSAEGQAGPVHQPDHGHNCIPFLAVLRRLSLAGRRGA